MDWKMSKLRGKDRDDSPEIPEYTVYRVPDEPYPVEHLGRAGLAHLVAISPAFDPPGPEFFGSALVPGKTLIRPMHKVAPDAFLLFEVSALGQDQQAVGHLDMTIQAMGRIANAWHSPEEYLGQLYAELPVARSTEGRIVLPMLPGLPIMAPYNK